MVEVFLDLDGVLVDFVGGACALHGASNPYLKTENHGKYELEKLISVPNFWREMNYHFWANLNWLPDGHLIIEAILKYVSPKQVTILTSPIWTPGCIDGKMYWIGQHLPQWKRRFFVGPGKEAIAAPGKLLIDDHDVNIDKWITKGGPAIQIPRVMNRLHKEPTIDYVEQRLADYFK